MNIALAFHAGDKEQAARWIKWVEEIGGIGKHRLFIMPAKGQVADFQTTVPFTVVPDSSGIQTDWSTSNGPVRDAAGANSMFRQFCWHFYTANIGSWMFMEPDAIPLREGWIDAIETEYNANRKHFMGALVPGLADQYPDHMTGVGVYSQRAVEMGILITLPSYTNIDGRRLELAFDVASAPVILQHFHNTKLIQHVFRGPKFKTRDDLRRVSPDAVLFHTDKDGGLIDLLRVSRGGEMATQEAHNLPCAGSIPAPATNIVYTYYRPIDGKDRAEQEWLLSQWAGRWIKAGWIPKVIGPTEAESHPFFADFMRLVSTIPTVNMREYEEACWLRWLAMVQVGGGMMTDYDVFNYGFTPNDVQPPLGDLPCILADHNPCPCAVVGTAQQYANMVNVIMVRAKDSIGVERGQPHLSDQGFVQKHAALFTTRDICFQHGRSGSDAAKLVHYSHSSCQGRSRREVIPAIEALRETHCAGRSVMDEIRERLEWVRDHSKGITRHHVHKELKKLGLLPKK